MSRREKVLIFLLGSLGDSIVSIPALRVVRHNFPDAELVVLHESGLGLVEPPQVLPDDLVDRYIGYVRGNLPLFSLLRLLPQLRGERFDAAVYLVFSERPARSVGRDRMFFRAAGIRRLIGFQPVSPAHLYPVDARGEPARVPSEAERKIGRLAADGLSVEGNGMGLPWLIPTAAEIATADTWLHEHRNVGRVLALAPGCKTKANEWHSDNFSSLISRVRDHVNSTVVIVGGPGESTIGETICRDRDDCTNAAGKFSVRETAALLSQCDAYVGLDTGTTHLAAAVGLPIVAIYGQRNNPGQWFPHAKAREIIQNAVPCAGCRARACTVVGHPCMTGINVEHAARAVIRTLERLTSDRPTRRAAEMT